MEYLQIQSDSVAEIKPEFLASTVTGKESSLTDSDSFTLLQPPKKLKVDEEEDEEMQNEQIAQHRKLTKKERRGQNKSKDRAKPFKISNKLKLCPTLLDGVVDGGDINPCSNPKCPFLHDVPKYLEKFQEQVSTSSTFSCHLYLTYGKCPRGLTCKFLNSHLDVENRKNLVNHELWSRMKDQYELSHGQILSTQVQKELRQRKFDFGDVEQICQNFGPVQDKPQLQTSGAVTDEDEIPLRRNEIKKLDWSNKLYLSPLTTVGNLPFRRLCVEYGADITCSEMALSTSLLQGNSHEFALARRHPSEKFWGVQLCGNNSFVLTKAAYLLNSTGIDYDFVDLNMGCPLEGIYEQGSGSGLMNRIAKFTSIVKSMTSVLNPLGKTFTVKMRTGIKSDKYVAGNFIKICKENGVGMVTLHGRSREQRYTKYADWKYIGDCVKHAASPMPLFGNGDVISWEDYHRKKAESGVDGIMIGRGALLKPWLFQEIKEKRTIDMNSTQRMEILKKYCNYGLDHWGSDPQGVETTRRFLLEWLSFYHRYIPVGLLAHPPQRINQRPPKYFGRDEIETMLASSSAGDWIKISEMFLGPVADGFQFIPKHKANAWGE